MPSETERWKTGELRNTVGHTDGATGPVTGGVEGHVESKPADKKPVADKKDNFDPARFTGAG